MVVYNADSRQVTVNTASQYQIAFWLVRQNRLNWGSPNRGS